MLWEETNLTENRASPSVISKISRSQRFSQKPKGSFTKFFCHVRKQFFDGKSRYCKLPPFPPPHIRKKLRRYQKFSKTGKGSFTNFFGTVRQNNLDGNSWHLPRFSKQEIFLNREEFLYEDLSSCGTTKFGREILILHPSRPAPHSHKFFGNQKPSALRKNSRREFFGLVRQQPFDGKSQYSILPPFPPPQIQKTRRYQNFHNTGKGSITNLLGTVRQNNFYGKSW